VIGTRLLNLNGVDSDHPEPMVQDERPGGTGGGTSTRPAMQAAFFLARRAATMNFWLMKSEPDECSIDDALAAPGSIVPWTGVRNYQARNFMRDRMKPGDGVLFYHSSCPLPGIAGLAEVASAPYPDPTQFDRKSKYYDAASTRATPRWTLVDIRALKKTALIPLTELRAHQALADMVLLRRGNRLSITPVTAPEWRFITSRLLKDV
jgi:predicted RNA-binding protein with PUA-like domain